jgi:hypothetical protein
LLNCILKIIPVETESHYHIRHDSFFAGTCLFYVQVPVEDHPAGGEHAQNVSLPAGHIFIDICLYFFIGLCDQDGVSGSLIIQRYKTRWFCFVVQVSSYFYCNKINGYVF